MAGSASNALENKLLDHILKAVAYTTEAPLYLALVTTAVGETDTGATLVEPTYTGYARKLIATADWNAAAGGSSTTNAIETFANCTAAGPSVVIGWALCSTSGTGTGNITVYGTCPSVTISTTQTPATVAAGALTVTCD